MKSLLNRANLKMFIKFGCVGVLNTIIDTAVFFLMCDMLSLNEVVSNVSAYLISSANSYFMNSKFVYKVDKYSVKKYIHFISGNILVLIISSLSVMMFARFFEVKTIAKLISMPITVVLNFLIQRFVIFKKSADKIK